MLKENWEDEIQEETITLSRHVKNGDWEEMFDSLKKLEKSDILKYVINQPFDSERNTILHIMAAQKAPLSATHFLTFLKYKPSPFILNNQGANPRMMALLLGQKERAEILAAYEQQTLAGDHSSTPYHYLVSPYIKRHESLFKKALERDI